MWPKEEVVSENGMVTALHPQASIAGLRILKIGGNAVDAAVATSLALGVVEPGMSGLGGRNFAVIYMHKSGEILSIDANGKASNTVKPGLFEPVQELAPEGWPMVKDDANTVGYKAICVPGNVACLSLILDRYGTMDWKEVTEPAIEIAEHGIEIHENHITRAQHILSKFPDSAKIYLKDGKPPKPGDRIQNKDLANSLRKIAEGGADAFYKGEIAEAIVKDMKENDGLITKKDLADYQPVILKTVSCDYRDYDFYYTLGASGGPTLVEILNIIEGFELSELGHNTPESIHILAEAMKLAYADRFKYIADPTHSKVPLNGLVSKEYAMERRKLIDTEKAMKVEPGRPMNFEEETTHFSVIDKERNMVSMTQSVHNNFGSGVVITSTGILMNNMMRRVNPLPGLPASIGPSKRALTYQSPHIVLNNGAPFLSLGAPGGSRILTTLVQVIVNILDHKMGIQKSMDASKFHCENHESLIVESAVPFKKPILKGLKKFGHNICITPPNTGMASPNGILVTHKTGKLHGGVDPRRPGIAIGH
jgi:gamma-glutamyltranspeptidase/glutathione hydrolase